MELGNFSSDNFEVVCPYDAADGSTVTLRYVPIAKAQAIHAKATKTTKTTRGLERETDDAKFAQLWGEWAVVGWSGFTMGGEEYPFTPENRDALMRGHRAFRKFVLDTSDDIEALTAIEREKTRGN
jgi:hypothetical protein